jgi:Tetratricopeptide repeat
MAKLVATEAMTMLKRVSTASERVLGTDSRFTLNTRGSLARAYAATGRWQKATVLYRQVLAGYERTLGSGHPMTRQYRDIAAQLPPWWLL